MLTTCPTNTTSVLSNEIVVDVRPLPILDIFSTPALNTSVTPIETCFGETYTLTAVGAISYSWTGGPASDIFVVQPSGNPSYTVTGISIDGCDATRVLDIQVNPLPVVSMLASPNAVCPGNNVVVGASGNAVTYTWTGQNSNAFLITVSPTVSTTYSVVGTGANSCTNMATQQVVVHPLPQLVPLSSVGSATICIGEPLALSVSGASTYTWTSPSVYTIGQLISVAPIVTTTYTVTGTDLNGCVSQTTIAQAVSACVGLNDEAFGNLNGLSIYPNPNNGVFIVELSNGANKVFELMDMTGRMILSSSTSNSTTEFSINDLANGIYYLRVQSNNTTQIVKVVKQ